MRLILIIGLSALALSACGANYSGCRGAVPLQGSRLGPTYTCSGSNFNAPGQPMAWPPAPTMPDGHT
jgi:hypothetical protein